MAKRDAHIVVVTTKDKATGRVIDQKFYSFPTRALAETVRARLDKNEHEYANDASPFYNLIEVMIGTSYDKESDVPCLEVADIEAVTDFTMHVNEQKSKPKKDKPIQLVQFREQDIVFSLDAHYKCKGKPVSKCKSGEYVYMRDGRIGVVEAKDSGYFSVHKNGVEHGVGKDTIVYPVTLGTSYVAEKITELRDKYYRLNIMNATFSRELEKTLDSAMQIYNDLNSEDGDSLAAKSAWEGLWEIEEKRLKELEIHAKALHIMPKQ